MNLFNSVCKLLGKVLAWSTVALFMFGVMFIISKFV